MLDFIIFAATAAVGLLIILIFYSWWGSQGSPPPQATDSTKGTKQLVPGWDREPDDPEMGDLSQLTHHGSLHQYLLHLHQNGRQPMAMFWWGKQRVVSVCNPDLLKETIKLTYRPKLLFTLFEPMIGPASIQYANGLDWEERRKTLYPTLRDDFLESYIPIFLHIADEKAEGWSQLPPDQPCCLQDEFFPMTIKGIARTCLGDVFEGEEEVKHIATAYHTCWDEMEQQLHVGPPEKGSEREKQFKESLEKLNKTVLSIVRSRKEGDDTMDIPFIDALLQSAVPEEQILSDTISFMVGGMHTSGYLLVWVVHYLTLHPLVMEELVAEMQKKVGEDRDSELREYVFSDKTYLRQILNETLRLSTLAPYAARFCDHDIVVGGYHIPAGTPVVHALGVLLKNESIWKCPHKFDPTQCGPGGLQSKNMMALSPFGVGRRKCPGYQFSYVEVGVFLTVLLQQFQVQPVEGEGVDCGQVHGLVTSPDRKLLAYVKPRQ